MGLHCSNTKMKYLTKRQRKRKKIQIFNRFGKVCLQNDTESGIGVDVDIENEVELDIGDDVDVDVDGDCAGDLEEKLSNCKVCNTNMCHNLSSDYTKCCVLNKRICAISFH